MKTIKFYFPRILIIGIFIIPICFFSCQDDFLEEQTNENTTTSPIELVDNNLQLKSEFAKALAFVLNEYQEVRSFIKNEALKKFDNDYDILYLLIKDEVLSCGLTFEEILLKHLNPKVLSKIQEQIPTLTIFVPELPKNSFSAEIWDTDKDVPLVGIRVKYDNNVPLYDAMGNKSTLPGDRIPAYPVLIIKENERVVANNEYSLSKIKTRSNIEQKFAFLDPVFNNISIDNIDSAPYKAFTTTDNITGVYEKVWVDERTKRTHKAVVPEAYRKILDAYDVYKDRAGWQRDYIYYDLTPTKTEGPFNYNMKECLLSFEMMGDANMNLAKISDQSNDPQRNGNNIFGSSRGHSYWTDGEFEFKVKTYLGNKSAIGNEIVLYFRVHPGDLFDMDYINDRRNPKNMVITGVKNKKAYLSNPLPLFEWNIENYSSNIKIAIEEVDAIETTRKAVQTTVDFASNFGFSANFGSTVKKGLQFGASAKESRIVTYEVTMTHGNDELGEVILNFADDIITSREILTNSGRVMSSSRISDPVISEGSLDYNNKYYNGWYRIYIAPIKMN